MNYKERLRERIIKKRIIKIINIFWFKSFILSFPWKIVLISDIVLLISLFLPWIIDNNKDRTFNSFNSISWNIWFFLIILVFIILFSTLSSFYKEKIKLYSDISFKNHLLIIVIWIFIILTSIISINSINWLDIFIDNIKFWNWVILSLTSWIFITLWWIFIRKEYKKSSIWIFSNNIESNSNNIEEKNNTKLPF